MPTKTADAWEHEIRAALRAGGSKARAELERRFFGEPIHSHGWKTADLRTFARGTSRQILSDESHVDPRLPKAVRAGAQTRLSTLVEVADRLFDGKENTATILGVLLLEKRVGELGAREFRMLERWLPRVTNWAQHDGLVYVLIGPMMVADAQRTARVKTWAKARGRWHRRAAAVALIQGARRGLFLKQTTEVANLLLSDSDDMVQKGLGWLLREWSKADPKRTIPLLLRLRAKAPRFVLRTACETLSEQDRRRVLAVAAAARRV